MRECGMSASSKNPHGERVGCCRARAVEDRDLADIEIRRQVAADDGVDALEHSGLDQLDRATRREFFRVLEEKTHLAAQLGTHPTEHTCGREQRRSMTIVPAGVHDTVDARCELDSTLFLNGKGVHVGAQSQRRPRPSTAKPGDDARRSRALDLEAAEGLEHVAHERCCQVLAEGKLRVRMQMSPPRDYIRDDLLDIHPREPNPRFDQRRVDARNRLVRDRLRATRRSREPRSDAEIERALRERAVSDPRAAEILQRLAGELLRARKATA
jgi:hypothetical protein